MKNLKGIKSPRFWILLAGLAAVLYISSVMFLAEFFSHSPKDVFYMYFDGLTIGWMAVVLWFLLYLARMHMDFLKGFRFAFSGKKGISRMELERSAKAFGYAEKIVILEGIIAFIIPIIEKCFYVYSVGLSKANADAEIVTMALMGLYILYPAIVILVLEPVKARLNRKVISYMDEPGGDEEKEAEEQKLFFKLRAMGLTDREAEIARLVCAEMSNVEIGKQLFISDATVKKHMTHILGKTGCADRRELMGKVMGV